MNDTIREEREALSKATPITIALACSIVTIASTGAWFTGRLAMRVDGLSTQQVTAEKDTAEWRKSATENSQMILRLIDKMDRRLEWVEKSQGAKQ